MTKKEIERKREQNRVRKQNQRTREREQGGRKAPNLSGQLTSGAAQGPLAASMNDFVFRKVDGNFYEILREGIPIFDAAIRRLITFNGNIKIIGENMPIVKELEDFCLNVPVNDMQKGIHAFAENAANETFEQGFSISEFVANRKRDDIERLVVADSKQIFFRRNKKTRRVEPWFRSGEPKQTNYMMPATVVDQILNVRYGSTISYNGVDETLLNPDNKCYFSINNENQDPHGVSLFRSTEFVAQILVTLQNSIKNVAERFGDPSYHVHLAAAAGDKNLADRRKSIETDFNTIITAKRKGKSGDFFTAAGPNSTVTVKVIGHDGQILQYEIPLRHLLEQIVAKTGLAAWLLGIYWSTTERMATLEVESALADAKIRQSAMLPEYIRLFSNFLRLRGRTWNSITTSIDQPGDWGLIFESPNLRDVLAMANARFLNAQADMMERGQAGSTATSIQIGQSTITFDRAKVHPTNCDCGKHHSALSPQSSELEKELSRPIPWPKLDEAEAGYETRLKSDWLKLRDKVFSILDLKLPEVNPAGKLASLQADKQAKAFSFDETQRKRIFDSLRDFLGWYEPTDPDSPVKWYYGEAYSLGLILAANLVGKERPLLDILRNSELFDKLVSSGFELVKDNATRAIKDDVIAAMQDGMTDGANPKDVARELARQFGNRNSDWERLARTEMGGAAEQGKRDEWEERGVDVSGYINGPRDIHPRCRCTSTVERRGDGWTVKFLPAPDACAKCFAAAEGKALAA